MTYEYALNERNELREKRHQALGDFNEAHEKVSESNFFVKLLNAEFNWGYWDAVVTIMKELKLKEIAV